MSYSKHINVIDLEYEGDRPFNKIIEIGLTVIERLETKHGSKNRICVVDCANEFDLFGEDCPFGKNIFNISDMFRIKTKQFRGVSLLEMVEYYGLVFEGRQHNGGDDSRMIGKVFLELLK